MILIASTARHVLTSRVWYVVIVDDPPKHHLKPTASDLGNGKLG
jgi:hypothetical protein